MRLTAYAGPPLHYGWVIVAVLSLTVTVSYGVLMYVPRAVGRPDTAGRPA